MANENEYRVTLDHLGYTLTANNNTFARKSALAALQTAVDDIEVPTKISDLDNDAEFQTADQVAAAVKEATVGSLKVKPVESLDDIDLTAEDAASYIYAVPSGDGTDSNICDEYYVKDGQLEYFGTAKFDPSGLVEKEAGKGLSTNDFTDDYKAQLDNDKTATMAQVQALIDEIYGTTTGE